jgi:hypothetical protein
MRYVFITLKASHNRWELEVALSALLNIVKTCGRTKTLNVILATSSSNLKPFERFQSAGRRADLHQI